MIGGSTLLMGTMIDRIGYGRCDVTLFILSPLPLGRTVHPHTHSATMTVDPTLKFSVNNVIAQVEMLI